MSLLLTLITCFLFVWIDHFEEVGGELLENPFFEDGLVSWAHSSNVVISRIPGIDLSNVGEAESHYIHQSFLVPRSGFIRLSADVEVVDVRNGPEAWQSARIGLLGREANGEWRWDFPGTLLKALGTQQLWNQSKVIEIPKAFSELRVECELSGGSGTFIVRRVSAQEVTPKVSITLIIQVLKVIWLLFVLMLLAYLFRLGLYLEILMLFLVSGLLLLIQESTKASLLGRIIDLMPAARYLPIDHFLLFFLISLVIFMPRFGRGTARAVQTLIAMIVFSLASEALQFFTSHRDPLITDAIANILGIMVAAMVVQVVSQLYSKIVRSRV